MGYRQNKFSTTVVIPALNEEKTIKAVVSAVRDYVGEVIVVDSFSEDTTAELAKSEGAKVVSALVHGKHGAIQEGIRNASGDLIIFIDADLYNPSSKLVTEPITLFENNPNICLAKGYYYKFPDDEPYGGRLTELCARPLISIYYPELSHILDPLSGEFAAWRLDLCKLNLWAGYAVDLGILVDLSQNGEIVEYFVNAKKNRHRKLSELGSAATEISLSLLHYKGLVARTCITHFKRKSESFEPVIITLHPDN